MNAIFNPALMLKKTVVVDFNISNVQHKSLVLRAAECAYEEKKPVYIVVRRVLTLNEIGFTVPAGKLGFDHYINCKVTAANKDRLK